MVVIYEYVDSQIGISQQKHKKQALCFSFHGNNTFGTAGCYYYLGFSSFFTSQKKKKEKRKKKKRHKKSKQASNGLQVPKWFLLKHTTNYDSILKHHFWQKQKSLVLSLSWDSKACVALVRNVGSSLYCHNHCYPLFFFPFEFTHLFSLSKKKKKKKRTTFLGHNHLMEHALKKSNNYRLPMATSKTKGPPLSPTSTPIFFTHLLFHVSLFFRGFRI